MNDFFLWDTYAFFEIIEGNPSYSKFANEKAATTILNIAELNYNLKKEMPKKMADSFSKKYFKLVVEILVEDIIKAGDLKKKNRKLSLPDCIGYVVAERLGAKFLTGDKEFQKMENVEFVK